jgi:hypothetical protein
MGFSDDQLLARETPDLRPPAQGLSDEDLLRREGLAPPRAKPELPVARNDPADMARAFGARAPMANFFDQFDAPAGGAKGAGNFFDRFDEALPTPPRSKPEPPLTAGEQYARGLNAGHFKADEETPLTRTLRAGQEQMDVPDSGYMNRALNAWQAMAAQGAGEVAKAGANALGIETGPAEEFAGEAMSALPGLMGAEGAPHIAPRPAEAVKPARERIEPIPPKLPEPPSVAKTALVNIAQGKPADAPPVDQAPVARARQNPSRHPSLLPRFPSLLKALL